MDWGPNADPDLAGIERVRLEDCSETLLDELAVGPSLPGRPAADRAGSHHAGLRHDVALRLPVDGAHVPPWLEASAQGW